MFDPAPWTVPPERAGAKLDKLVAEMARVSRREARLLIAMGRVRVNRRALRILARPIPAGARLEIQPGGPAATPATASRPALLPRIVYLDRWLVALDKPAGLLSETDRFGSPSLQTVVPKLLAARGEHERLWLVHRLDAGTSGVILMARTPGAAAHLSDSFRRAAVGKTYVALCSGHLATAIAIEAPIGRDQGTRHAVRADGRPAQTAFVPLQHGPQATYVQATPRTGRTHQIRVHLAHAGHPILGDRLYGGLGYAPANAGHERVARPLLHAQAIAVPHPDTAEMLRVSVPPPADFATVARSFGFGDLKATRA